MPAFAVLGSPIDHSLSPVLHAAGYAALGLSDFHYERFEVPAGALASFLEAHPDHLGFSVTMPLKAELIELAAAHGWPVDRTAALTGSGNTLVRSRERAARVLNTDVAGIVAALSEARPEAPRTGAVLGNGATAASAVVALSELGVGSVDFAVRRPERAAEVVALAQRLELDTSVTRLAEWRPGGHDLTVSTLPAGSLDGRPLSWPQTFAGRPVVLDAAYAPAEVDLLHEFAVRGGVGVPGVRMLVHQAVEQFLAFAATAGVALDADAPRAVEQAMTAAVAAHG
ncbi:shikimate dehydrogenase [Brevibacterium daeguense]|uniref:Shikimate dehydrogenase n=1 Tax=Brevibacterium daeguense TaxID=909936 RepID=A0ABP8EN57_9MICO